MKEDSTKIHAWLYPISFLYGIGVSFRNRLFDWGILRSKSFDVPIICIGNIAAGGTGKTPHTEYLIKLLQDEATIAMLSRGYKRHTKGYVLATPQDTAQTIGDEPYQVKTKFPNIHVAVDEDRCRGIEQLCKIKSPEVEVVLLDDAFQHRYVQVGINILLTDYYRLFCDDALLPAGRLRESAQAKHRATIVVVTKCPPDIKPIDYNIIAKRLDLYPYQQLFFSSFKYGSLQPVFPAWGASQRELSTLAKEEKILLLTGIASPIALVNELERYTSQIDLLTFDDHHEFSKKDIKLLKERFDKLGDDPKIIITTEKDATRLINHPTMDDELKRHIYALPIEVEILQNQQDMFNQQITGYVRKNKRNSILSKKKDAHKS